MKIAIDARYLENEGGGINRYIKEIISKSPESHEIFCISTLKLRNLPKNVKNVVLPLKKHWIVWEQIHLPILLSILKPDIYHAAGNWGVPIISKYPAVVTIHDVIPLRMPSYFKDSKHPFISKYLYKIRIFIALNRAKKIIVTTDEVKKDILKRFWFDHKKIVVIPQGVSRVFFNPVSKKDKDTLHKMKIFFPYILMHGGIDKRKNIGTLLKAYAQFLDTKNLQYRQVHLIITGKENPDLKLKELSQELGISKKVIFTGWVTEEEVSILARNAKAIIYPTLDEGFGMPVLEGMASGRPVIASNIPVLKSLGKDIPMYITPTDFSSIVEGIKQAVSILDKEKLDRGIDLAKNYTWDKTVLKTYEIYNIIRKK